MALFALSGAMTFADNTVTITPSTTQYSAGGGTISFSATLGYDPTVKVVGLTLAAPAGWTFGKASGPNTPSIAPKEGDTGEFSFTYVESPTTPATFTFTVNYPSGLTGVQEFKSIAAVFRPAVETTVTKPSIQIKPSS